MWASKVGANLYCLDNIPFLTEHVSYRDIVRAEPEDPEKPQFVRFLEVAEHCGHSTFWVQMNDGEEALRDGEVLLQLLRDLDCMTENARDRLVSIDVPPKSERQMDYVWQILAHAQENDIWLYGVGFTATLPPWERSVTTE